MAPSSEVHLSNPQEDESRGWHTNTNGTEQMKKGFIIGWSSVFILNNNSPRELSDGKNNVKVARCLVIYKLC